MDVPAGPRTLGGPVSSVKSESLVEVAGRPRSHAKVQSDRPSCPHTTPSASNPSGKPTGSATRRFARPTSLPANPSYLCSTCSRTPAAPACTWGTQKATPPPISSAASNACAVITCCTPWVGMPSACPPNSTPFRPIRTQASPLRRISRPSAVRSNRWVSRTTGTAKSIQPIPPTIDGLSGSFCASITRGTTPSLSGPIPRARPARERAGRFPSCPSRREPPIPKLTETPNASLTAPRYPSIGARSWALCSPTRK